MTCTHAALKRRDFLSLGFHYDNLLMEESAQILEIETFIPMLLQRPDAPAPVSASDNSSGGGPRLVSRLKRCILIGDHNQLPPVVKNLAFQKFSHMDQSLFTRFIRLGVPHTLLDAQGRASRMIMQVHDELVLEVPDAELDWVKAEVPRLMASVAQLRVPLLAEVGSGPNWESAH